MNITNPFERLAPFIQSYIYKNGWHDLREIQKAAIPAILDTSNHILIMSGTASGKTEAAILPALTVLEQTPINSVGILYIGPLKALINDQFERIQTLLQEKQEEIPIQGWHGDISYHQKKQFLKRPRGILQITPESMEALLINRPGEIKMIFGDLLFIIIDEIHAFLGTERGQQVLCQLQRLERAIGRSIRSIGLSATIGDADLALRWLESSSRFQTRARLVKESTSGRRIELRVNHFILLQEKTTFQAPEAPLDIGMRQHQISSKHMKSEREEGSLPVAPPDQRLELQQPITDYYDDLFTFTKRYQKTLIFTNRRNEAEKIAAALRQRLNQIYPGRDWYFVHHSSIAANLREETEEKMRDKTLQSCTIATASLELGIDIGQLDLTIQIKAPHTVSSFVQRLGRSGRRGTPSRMCLYTFEYLSEYAQNPSTLKQIPWNFLQTIAILQLYLEEQWIEPPDIPTMPLSLLYQQTMSIMQAQTELTPAQLAHAVLTLSPFQAITQDDYRLFLLHLIKLDHLARMDEGTLIVGMKGAQRTNHYQFYAIFANDPDYQVMAGSQEIGTLNKLPEVDTIIGLAGYAWRVFAIDEKRRIIHVERAKGDVNPAWSGSSGIQCHEHLIQRIRQVLEEDSIYAYLSPPAKRRLSLVRELARNSRWLHSNVAPLAPGRFVLFPWTNWRICTTLIHTLSQANIHIHHDDAPYYLEIAYNGTVTNVINKLHDLSPYVPNLIQSHIAKLPDMSLWQGKYDYLMPRPLLEKAYINDVLDIPGTMEWLANCS